MQVLNNATYFWLVYSSAVSNYQACLNQGGPLAPITCYSQVTKNVTNALNSSSTTLNQILTAIQILNQIVGTSPNSAAQTAPPTVNATIQSLQQTAQRYTSQISGISQQTSTCILQAANTARAG